MIILMSTLCLGVLAGGTGAGHVAMWQFSPIVKVSPVNKPEPEDHWKLQPPSTIEGAISSLCVSRGYSLFSPQKSIAFFFVNYTLILDGILVLTVHFKSPAFMFIKFKIYGMQL